jgi:hypothetical protein
MGLIAQVVGQLDLHRPLHQPLGQLRKQPAGPDDLLFRSRSRKQLVDELVGQLLAHLIRQALKDPSRGRRLA